MTRRSFGAATVLVTGAGGGLGREIARCFASAGARIAALDTDVAGITALEAELAARGAECIAVQCDVTDEAACAAAIAACAARFGGLDVLVNNAGISHRSGFAQTDPSVIRRVMDVNFNGAVHCTRAALPWLIRRRGLIIVISSVAGFTPLIARTGYAASKHALHGFFSSLRTELASAGVGVLLACPAFIATRIDRNALGADGAPARHAQVTIGRPLSPEAVAAMIVAGAGRGRRQLLIGRTAHLAWWASRLAPGLYDKLMARRLAGELESGTDPARAAQARKQEP